MSSFNQVDVKKVTVSSLRLMKGKEKISCLTAYDYTSGRLIDRAGIDLILVGDSLSNVIQGNVNSLPVTVDEMIYHTKLVRRGVHRAFLAIDMPFGSYHRYDLGMDNAVRMIKESGAEAVKLEGASELILRTIKDLTSIGVPVIGHIGLQPQMVNVMGGFKVQGRNNADQLLQDACNLESAGAFMVVLEGIVDSCATSITAKLSIPTIGIGAGLDCDGQILVYHDVFGLYDDIVPKFVKKYEDVGVFIDRGAKKYISEVKSGDFPSCQNIYKEKVK